MGGTTRLERATATGNLGPASGGLLWGVTLSAGADAATVVVREGGSGGTVLLTVKAAINTTVNVRTYGSRYTGQLHLTFTGTSPEASIEL